MGSPSLSFPNIDAAISQFEGFGTPNTRATINNNPGNLIYGTYAIQKGATGQDNNGFAVFPTVAAGAMAEDSLVQYYSNQGDTLGQLINSWAPPTAPGNSSTGTQSYTDYVAKVLGTNSNTLIPNAEKGVSANNTSGVTSSGTGLLGTLNQATTGLQQGIGNFLGMGLVSNSLWSRVSLLVLGLILIGGGILLFKPVSKVVIGTVKKAGLRAL